MSRETKLVKSTLILSIGTLLPKLTSFITLPILTACLSKEQYGTYDLIAVLVSLILPVTTLQIHTAAFRFLIDKNKDRELAKLYLSNILAFVIPVSVLVLTVLFFFLPINSTILKFCVCIYFFFDTVVTEVRQVARGLQRNLDYSICAVISTITSMILTVMLVGFCHMELLGAIIALTCAPILSLIYICIRIQVTQLIDFSMVSGNTIKEMLSYSWPMVPNNMSGWVMRVSDRFVVTGFMGLSANAVYGVANKIPSLLLLAQSTFGMAWQENASVASNDKDAETYYTKMFSSMMKFYAGFFGIIIAVTPILFKVLIKGDYSEAIPQMPILFLSMFFSCMSSFLGGIYIAKKATKSVGITTVIAALCNLIVDLALIKKIGLFAASGSTLISYIFLFIYRMIDIRKYIKIRYNLFDFLLTITIISFEALLFYIESPVALFLNSIIALAFFWILNREIIVNVWRKIFLYTRKS